jgi:hypothetical protein
MDGTHPNQQPTSVFFFIIIDFSKKTNARIYVCWTQIKAHERNFFSSIKNERGCCCCCCNCKRLVYYMDIEWKLINLLLYQELYEPERERRAASSINCRFTFMARLLFIVVVFINSPLSLSFSHSASNLIDSNP